MGRQSHFNVPQDRVTAAPLFQRREPPEFKPIMDNNHITAQYIKGPSLPLGREPLWHISKINPFEGCSLDACRALNVSHGESVF